MCMDKHLTKTVLLGAGISLDAGLDYGSSVAVGSCARLRRRDCGRDVAQAGSCGFVAGDYSVEDPTCWKTRLNLRANTIRVLLWKPR